MPRKKTAADKRRTLLDHYRELVLMAAAHKIDVYDRDHARCFIAGAMATLCLLKRAAKTHKAEVYVRKFYDLEAEVDAFLAEESEIAGLAETETGTVQ